MQEKIISQNQAQKPLWAPSAKFMEKTELANFVRFLEKRQNIKFGEYGEACYKALLAWSVDPETTGKFWSAVWDYCGVLGEKNGPALEKTGDVPWVKFFPEAKLNYAENALQSAIKNPEKSAIIYRHQGGVDKIITGKELCASVSLWEQALRSAGIGEGDAVALYLTNVPETDIILYAAANIGAVLCTAGMEIGGDDLINRFGRVKPKILITAPAYVFGDKEISRVDVVERTRREIPSIQTVVALPVAGAENVQEKIPNSVSDDQFLKSFTPAPLVFERRDFNHPLYILFSSGTTGEPKCFVHGTGGILLKHLVEHKFQSDVRPGDRLFYHATPSWMMWNWAASALLAGAVNLKYDGRADYPDGYAQWRFTATHKATHHGTAAPVILGMMQKGLDLKQAGIEASDTRVLMYTGAPLPPQGFEYASAHLVPGVQISSICGGTDLVGCHVTGNPFMSVYAGQTAAAVLGMDIQVWDEEGKPAKSGEAGELVCVSPFPSMPLRFLGDADGARYRDSYFDFYKDVSPKPVWRHGDSIEETAERQFFIIGRSDATLNQNGVRIGTGAIYNQLSAERIGADWAQKIQGAMAIDFKRPSDGQTVTVLFLALEDWEKGVPVDLQKTIRAAIKNNVGPYSVPRDIIAAPGVLKTKNGKLAEVVAKKIVNGAASGQKIPNPSLYGEELVAFYERVGVDLARKRGA